MSTAIKPSMENRSWKSFTTRAGNKPPTRRLSSSATKYGLLASLTFFLISFYHHQPFIISGSLKPLLSWLTFKPCKHTKSDTRRPKISNVVIYYEKLDLIKDTSQDDQFVLACSRHEKTFSNSMADIKTGEKFNNLAIYEVSVGDKCYTVLNKTHIIPRHNYPFGLTHIHKETMNKKMSCDEVVDTHSSISLDNNLNPFISNHKCLSANLHQQNEAYTPQNSFNESGVYFDFACGVEPSHPIYTAGAITETDITYDDTASSYLKASQKFCDKSQHLDTSSTLSFATRSAISGFFGGAAAFLLTFPIYTLFVRRSMAKSSVCTCNRLFDGAMLGTFATAISDAIYFKVYSSSTLLALPATMRSVIASFTNSIATSPFWVIVTHKQLMAKDENAFEIASEIYRHRGFSAFFDSLILNLIMCIYPVVRQLALELIVHEWNITRSAHVALAATLASIVATVVTYPIQKWRIMLHSGELAPKVVDKWHFLSDGLLFKLLDTCLKTFILFLVKEHIIKYITC